MEAFLLDVLSLICDIDVYHWFYVKYLFTSGVHTYGVDFAVFSLVFVQALGLEYACLYLREMCGIGRSLIWCLSNPTLTLQFNSI